MSSRELVTYIEIDLDFCSRTFGTAPCGAVLSNSVRRKCFNTFRTCTFKSAYQKVVKTLRFSEPRSNLPRGLTIFPCIEDITDETSSVNIAGSDERLSAFGDRAEIRIRMRDFQYHDRLTDQYQSERVSGAAQNDEPGYDPGARGTFWTKLHSRNPYYYGRPLRRIDGHLDSGVFVQDTVRHYIIKEIELPGEDGTFDIRGQDVLALASDDKALIPKPSTGTLLADITDVAATATLTPAGIGNIEYPASGIVTIGSEMMGFTRAGDVLTLTTRGHSNTKASSHKLGDTVQIAFSVRGMRVDNFVNTVLTGYGSTPASFIPLISKWKPEIDRWAPGVTLWTDICSPMGVTKVIGELASLGFSISWDDTTQEVGLKANRPVDNDVLHLVSDRDIISISSEKRDEDRLSQVVFFTVQRDPTKSVTDLTNYDIVLNKVDAEAQGPNEYQIPIIRNIPVRFFNNGETTSVSVLSKRLLARFRDPPTIYKLTLTAEKARNIKLTDVLEVTTDRITDTVGRPTPTLLQVIRKRDNRRSGHVDIVAQVFFYKGRYGFITENTRPVYSASSAAQKKTGAYFLATGQTTFADGGEGYRFI